MATVAFTKINPAGAGAPAATDDETEGYSALSLWLHGSNPYLLADETEDAANWLLLLTGENLAGSGDIFDETAVTIPTVEDLHDAGVWGTCTYGTTTTPAVATNGFNQVLTLTDDVTTFAAPTGLADGQTLTIAMLQDGTGGHVITAYAATYRFPGGTQFQPADAANAESWLYITRRGSNYYAVGAADFSAV